MHSKPKLAIITGPYNSATSKVMLSHLPAWEDQFDIKVLEYFPQIHVTLDDFDLVHLAWLGYVQDEIVPPFTANVWQVGPKLIEDYTSLANNTGVARIIVDDRVTRNTLGQITNKKVELIPLAFTYPQKILPYPAEFTIGYFGNNYVGKRFDVIEEAGNRAKVKVAGYGFNKARPIYNLNPEELYQTMSVYVHASYCDTNSMPAMEALMHGRPVIAVWSDGLARVLEEPRGGLWFDGTVEDLAAKIAQVRSNFRLFADGATSTQLLSVEESARKYAKIFHDVLDEN